jgi:ArsR family transcriptional regulator, arsenate/arsenite/antimonite-responsive transcriptional repressor / arsenate reductase (thioredoxin)
MQQPALATQFSFLRLLAHRLRWQLLLLLAHSDYGVQELVSRLRQPQNLVSYHLRRLRDQQLVHQRRSAADRRDVYYSLNLLRFRQLYLATGQSLDPGLGESNVESKLERGKLTGKPRRVLFLCTHNSARSQMAEGLLRHLGGTDVEVFSAGTEPSNIRAEAIEVMRLRGIDISGQRSKHLHEYVKQSFDYVVTVCDRAKESCPIFPGDPEQIHWSFPDPSSVSGSREVRLKAFEQIARELTTRINFLLILIRRNQKATGDPPPRSPRS